MAFGDTIAGAPQQVLSPISTHVQVSFHLLEYLVRRTYPAIPPKACRPALMTICNSHIHGRSLSVLITLINYIVVEVWLTSNQR